MAYFPYQELEQRYEKLKGGVNALEQMTEKERYKGEPISNFMLRKGYKIDSSMILNVVSRSDNFVEFLDNFNAFELSVYECEPSVFDMSLDIEYMHKELVFITDLVLEINESEL